MVLFVTGGSRGIGTAIVLAAIRAGHDVAFTYLQAEAEARGVVAKAKEINPDKRCLAYALDVRDSKQVDAVGEQVLSDLDTVDAVVSNAGVNRNGLAVSMSDDDWRFVIDTNLSGSFFVTRQFLPTFLANGHGRFILISSVAQGGISGQVNYSASKAGLVGLSGALAKEYGRKGITSNVVSPGFFGTDMTRETMSQKLKDYCGSYCPAGRMGELDEIASVVLFLASKESSYVNGQVISVTGGLDWSP
jgi:NAD(P)-dependent dehydrogenase (short-subunit alcohol dehydrogenase family)